MNVLEELKIEIAPYIRNTLIGHGNRLGKGALYEGKVENADNTYKLGGKTQTIEVQSNQDYFKITAFVEKILKRELGGSNKTNRGWDNIITEVLHVIKFDNFSNKAKFRNVMEGQIRQEAGFKEAKEALSRLESQGELSNSLDTAEVKGLSEVVEHGDFGKLKNEIILKESEIYDSHSTRSKEDRAGIEEELKKKKQQGIEMQEKFKKRAKDYLNANSDNLKETKQRCKELAEIMENNSPGSEAYEGAAAQMRQIAIDKKDLFDHEREYKKAVEEIRDMKKTHEFAPSLDNNDVQKEA